MAVVRRAFVAWNAADFDAVAADSASDVVWNLSRVDLWTERDTYSGLLELRVFWDLRLGVWVDHHLELLELLANDDKVFCRYRQTATGKASGASVEVENGQVVTFRDGKVIRTDVYSDPPRRPRRPRRPRLPGSGCSAYQALTSSASLRGYLQYLTGTARRWK